MTDAILVLNAGSSSIKFSVFVEKDQELELMVRGQIEGLFTAPHFVAKSATGAIVREETWREGEKLDHAGAIEYLRKYLRERRGGVNLLGIGHRVAHGGIKHFNPVRVDKAVLAELERIVPLVPLHQPHNLAPIKLALEKMPSIPQVACFDTGFHHTNPPLAQMFALPRAMTEAGLRRYGFHGLSYEYIASILPERAPEAAKGKTIVLHLGSGSSMCALDGGKSVASTMGFSALDGLPMGTRCGSLDPGVILFLLDYKKMNARAIEQLLYKESGLLGVSGISNDVRELLQSEDPAAKLALDLYVYRIGREMGSLAAALGGLDAIVFTAGVGENAPKIRESVCRNAAWLGIELDPVANGKPDQSGLITKASSRVKGWVLGTNEELMIARHTLHVIGAGLKEDTRIAA